MGPEDRPPLSCSSTLTLGGRHGCQLHTLASVCLQFQVGTGLGRRVWPGFQPHCPFHSSHHTDAAHSADGDTARASVRRGDCLREEEVHFVVVWVRIVRDPGGQHKPGVWEVTGRSWEGPHGEEQGRGEPMRRRRGTGTPGTPLGLREWSGDGLPLRSPLPPRCWCQGQNPVSLALHRALSSPCRRFWSESERKAGRGPPDRKIMASCPRKSALRPVYSSPPRVGVGAESGEEGQALNLAHPFPMMLANPHLCHAGPGLGVTHLQRCWRRDDWARVGISPSHFPCFGAPDGAHAGEREGDELPGKAVPAPYPGSGHCVRLDSGVGGRRPHSGPCQ